MQPVRIKNVDLTGVSAQRRKAGRIPGHVESGADAFFLIQLDLRRRDLRLAVRAGGLLLLAVAGFFFFTFLERLKGALLRGKQEFRQGFIAQRRKDKKNDQSRDDDRNHVEQAAQVFPPGASRIIKDWFRHGG